MAKIDLGTVEDFKRLTGPLYEGSVKDAAKEIRPVLTEATNSVAPKMIRNAVNMLDGPLKAKAKKYGAMSAVVTGMAKGIEVALWIDGPKDEAEDVAKVILGSGFTMAPHKLRDNVFVARVVYTLADIF